MHRPRCRRCWPGERGARRGRGGKAGDPHARAAFGGTTARGRNWPSEPCGRGMAAPGRPRPDGEALGRPTDTVRDTVASGRVAALRLHGRLASSAADQSRAIALHRRAEEGRSRARLERDRPRPTTSWRTLPARGDRRSYREHITKAGRRVTQPAIGALSRSWPSRRSIMLARSGVRQARRPAHAPKGWPRRGADESLHDGVKKPGRR